MDRVKRRVYPNILVFGDSNNPDMEDSVIRRFTDYIEVQRPCLDDRKAYIKSQLKPCTLTDDQVEYLAKKSNHCSYSEIWTMLSQMKRGELIRTLKSKLFKKNQDGTYSECRGKDINGKNFHQLPENSLRVTGPPYEKLKARFDNPICGLSQRDIDDIEDFKKKYMKNTMDLNDL